MKLNILILIFTFIFISYGIFYNDICGLNWFLNEHGICERCWDHNVCPGEKYSYQCEHSFFRFYASEAYEKYPVEVIDEALFKCCSEQGETLINCNCIFDTFVVF